MCLDTTIIHYPNDKDKKQKKKEAIDEAVELYYKNLAQKNKNKQETTIKLK